MECGKGNGEVERRAEFLLVLNVEEVYTLQAAKEIRFVDDAS